MWTMSPVEIATPDRTQEDLRDGASSRLAVALDVSSDHGVVGPNVKVGSFAASTISSTNTTTISPT
jgi:hypothetical protein